MSHLKIILELNNSTPVEMKQYQEDGCKDCKYKTAANQPESTGNV